MNPTTSWLLTPESFPQNGSLREQVQFCVEVANLAPSAHNTQPWRVEVSSDNLTLFQDPAHSLQAGDPTGRQTYLGLGAFLENLSIAAQFFSIDLSFSALTLIPTVETPICTIGFKKSTEKPPVIIEHLYNAITKRHTNRGLYDPAPLPTEFIQLLLALSDEETSVFALEKAEEKAQVGTLIGKGITIGLELPALREELAHLISFSAENRSDGMLAESMNQAATKHPGKSGKEWFETKLLVTEESAFSQKKFSEAPLILIIASKSDTARSWLNAGRLMQKILLSAADKGYTHCISAAPVEIPTISPNLRPFTKGMRPQVVLRIGIPLDPSFTHLSPRRTVFPKV